MIALLKTRTIKAADYLKENLPFYLKRALLSWVMISLFYIANGRVGFTEILYFEEVKSSVFFTSFAVLMVLLCRIREDKFISVLLIVSAVVYAVFGVIGFSDFCFSLGCCAAVGLMIYLSKGLDFDIGLHGSVKWVTAAVLIICFTVFVGGICCLYYNNHWTSCFDFGIFAQMFYHMKESGLPLVTCERDSLLSHYAVHISPIYYLLLPIYMVFPDPKALLILQALIVASGVIPLILICRNHKLSEPAIIAFSLIYTLTPCFAGGCFTYLHENNFLAPLILWLIYFFEKEHAVPKLIFLVLLLLVKEDAAVYAAIICIYFLFTDKNYKCNLIMLAISLLYFVLVTHLLLAYGEGVMTGRYDNYIYDGSGSLTTLILAAIKNPVYVIQQSFNEDKIIFILQMLVPLGFMPFITKRTERLILLIPFMLVNLMTAYQYQFNIGFQYGFGSGALLIYLSVINYSELKCGKLLLCSLCSSVIIFFGLYYHRTDYLESYKNTELQRAAIDKGLALIPNDASVVSSTFLLPNLSQRDEIYELERTDKTAEYYVLDLRYQTDEFSFVDYMNDDYELVFYEDSAVVIFKRKAKSAAK